MLWDNTQSEGFWRCLSGLAVQWSPLGLMSVFLRSTSSSFAAVPGKLPEVLRRQLSLAPGLRPAAQLLIKHFIGVSQSLLAPPHGVHFQACQALGIFWLILTSWGCSQAAAEADWLSAGPFTPWFCFDGSSAFLHALPSELSSFLLCPCLGELTEDAGTDCWHCCPGSRWRAWVGCGDPANRS